MVHGSPEVSNYTLQMDFIKLENINQGGDGVGEGAPVIQCNVSIIIISLQHYMYMYNTLV